MIAVGTFETKAKGLICEVGRELHAIDRIGGFCVDEFANKPIEFKGKFV